MSLTIGDNFSYNGAKPLDARLTYSTLAEMANKADSTLYNGILAYCVATDKTYQWKSTNPIDPDTGRWREVSSGGGETIQVAELPAASEDEEGKIYQYIGADTSTLTHGYYYECVSDGEDPATYSWEPTKVQDTPEAMSQNDVEEIINGLVIDPLDMPEPMTQSDLEEVKDAFSPTGYNPFTIGIGGGYAPIGTIIQYMGVTAPQDYLKCDGTVYNIADYPQLAEVFTAQFGSANHFGGDGATTFAVPDLRGEFLRGTGTNSHENQGSGASVGKHQDGTRILNMSIGYGSDKSICSYSNRNVEWEQINRGNADYSAPEIVNAKGNGNAGGSVGQNYAGSEYFIPRPTNTSVLYCIKAIVAGEVYSTEERVVGTWIDGKKLYQKVIIASLPSEINNSQYVAIGASVEYGMVVNAMIQANGIFIPIPSQSPTTDSGMTRAAISSNAFVEQNKNAVQIRTANPEMVGMTVYIVIRYTKTTD